LTLLTFILGGCVLYLLVTLGLTYLVLQLPRNPVEDKPDWGRITETTIPTEEGGLLEVWRVAPEGPSRGIVVLVHGWGRNRDSFPPGRAKTFVAAGSDHSSSSLDPEYPRTIEGFINRHLPGKIST
jgi:hypothetical protein